MWVAWASSLWALLVLLRALRGSGMIFYGVDVVADCEWQDQYVA